MAWIRRSTGRDAVFGHSVRMKGELISDEDLTIEGSFEGTLVLNGRNLIVGGDGQVVADVEAHRVIVAGVVKGKIIADDKVEIASPGTVKGKGSPDGKIADVADCTFATEISAHSVVVLGEVIGNITAEDKVEIGPSGTVLGNITARRVVMADGAMFKGRIDMVDELANVATPVFNEAPRRKTASR
jgi:cytoskeletal protein CcmA (bactofilin family)